MSDPPSSPSVPLSPVARKAKSRESVAAFLEHQNEEQDDDSDSSTLIQSSSSSFAQNGTSLPIDNGPSQSYHASSTTTTSSTTRIIDKLLTLLPLPASRFITENVGLTLVASAQIFFVAMALTVKYFVSTTQISTATLIFVRMSITGLLCSLALKFYLKDPNPFLGPEGVRGKLVLRGLFGWVGLASNYNSLRGLSVSDSVTIQFLSPSVTALLGFILLKEKMSRKEIMAGFACLFGVVLVSRPPFLFGTMDGISSGGQGSGVEGGGTRLDLPPAPFPGEGDTEGLNTQTRFISVCWALSSVIGAALAYITIRSIGTKANALHSIGYFSYMCTITSFLWMLIGPKPIAWVDNLHDTIVILAIGIFGFIAQTLLTMGLQREKAGRAGLAMYLQVVIALVVEFLLWHTIPSLLSMLGTFIILFSAFWAATSKSTTSSVIKDPENQAFSRSTTPIPPPQSDRPPLRGEHYSYESTNQNDIEAGQALLTDHHGGRVNGLEVPSDKTASISVSG